MSSPKWSPNVCKRPMLGLNMFEKGFTSVPGPTHQDSLTHMYKSSNAPFKEPGASGVVKEAQKLADRQPHIHAACRMTYLLSSRSIFDNLILMFDRGLLP